MNLLVCGRMKEGKTSFALVALRRWPGGKIAWDPRHMIDEEMAQRAGYKVLTLVDSPEELEDAIEDYEPGELIVVRPTGDDLSSEFSRLIGVLLNPPERYHNWALLVDEARTLQSAYTIAPDLDRIVRQHPRSALIIQTTHSLQDWHRASRDLTNYLVAFRLRGKSLDAFIEYCDGSDDMRQDITDLPRHYAIIVDMGAGPDDPEYQYIEPRTWWNKKDFDIRDFEAYERSDDGQTSRTTGEGDREAERPVEQE